MVNNTKFNIKVSLPNKQFTCFEDVSVNIYLSPIDENSREALFSTTIPKHMYDVVSQHGVEYVQSNKHTKHSDIASLNFKPRTESLDQTITNQTLNGLLCDLTIIGRDAKNIKELLKMSEGVHNSEKFLAVKFVAQEENRVSSFYHATMRREIRTTFQFFVLYRAITEDMFHNKRYAYHSDEIDRGGIVRWHALSQNIDVNNPNESLVSRCTDEFKGFTLVKWTQQREDFLMAVQNKFEALNGQLRQYLDDLNEEKIEQLILSAPSFLALPE